MADAYYVQLDLEKIRRRLKWSDGRGASAADVQAWLRANDFLATEDPAVWLIGRSLAVERELQCGGALRIVNRERRRLADDHLHVEVIGNLRRLVDRAGLLHRRALAGLHLEIRAGEKAPGA